MREVRPLRTKGPAPQRSRGRVSLARGLAFVLAAAVAYGLEHYAEHLTAEEGGYPASTSLFNARNVYQYLVSAWPRELVPRHTVLLHIDPALDTVAAGLAHNVCQQREFLGTLLKALETHRPSTIVIDKFFLRSGCNVSESTRQLQSAVQQVSAATPVVVGIRVKKELLPDHKGGTYAPVWEPHVSFSAGSGVSEGVVNTAADRTIPLGWLVAEHPEAPTRWMNSLSLQAAQTHDPMIWKNYPLLTKLKSDFKNPYLSLIPPARFVTFHAGDVICASTYAGAWSVQCAGRPSPAMGLEYLRGRMVIVGEVNRDIDMHSTVIGTLPGSVLQANYVEALLDNRYFVPVRGWVDFLVGFVIFLAVELALQHTSAIVCLVRVAGVLLASFVVISLVVRYTGYYVNPVTISGFVLSIKLITWLMERVTKHGERRHDH